MCLSLLNIMLCVGVPAAWVAVGFYCRRCERRRGQQEKLWARFARNRIELDRELDHVWDLLKRLAVEPAKTEAV